MSDVPQRDSYALIFAREGSSWRATLDGPGMPGHGRYITGKTIASLNDRTHELFDDLPNESSWYLEYSSPASPIALHDYTMAYLDVSQKSRKNSSDGHALAAALAADGATISDIAAATHTSYLEAAWLLATQPPPTRLFATSSMVRADRRRYYRTSIASLLRVIAGDRIRQVARPR